MNVCAGVYSEPMQRIWPNAHRVAHHFPEELCQCSTAEVASSLHNFSPAQQAHAFLPVAGQSQLGELGLTLYGPVERCRLAELTVLV